MPARSVVDRAAVKLFPTIAVLLSFSAVAHAQGPARAEGLLLRIEPGYALWSFDAEHIQRQTTLPPGDVQGALVDQTPNAPSVALVLGYNVEGHIGIAASLTATGWDLGDRTRGGAGFGALELSWHPAELVPAIRSRDWDASLFFGAGYFVLGEQRALDGLHYQLGARGEYFVSDWLSVGATLRHVLLSSSRYIVDWNNEVSQPLPQGSRGNVFLPALSLTVHAPLGG